MLKKTNTRYPIGTATTLKKHIEFQHAFPSYPNTLLYRKGLHQSIEAWMLEHPGERLPGKKLAERFKCSAGQVNLIAKRIEESHNLPKRKQGGPNFTILPASEEIIQKAIAEAKKTKQPIDTWKLITEIARETGEVVTFYALYLRKQGLVLKNSKKFWNMQAKEIQKALENEGITITKVRTRRPKRK